MLSENRDLSFRRGYVSPETMQVLRDELAWRKDDWLAPLRTLRENTVEDIRRFVKENSQRGDFGTENEDRCLP